VKTLLIILGEFLHTLNVKQLASIRDGFKCLIERITTPSSRHDRLLRSRLDTIAHSLYLRAEDYATDQD
jgi:hypothetical protein